MDAFDRAILNELQTDSRISTEELGNLVGLSASACQRRIKKLRELGIINREVTLLDSERLEGYVTIIVDLILEKGGEIILDNVFEQLNREKRVQQVYYTAGDVDLVVIMVVKNMSEYDDLTRRLFMANSNVKKFQAKVAIKPKKLGLALPL